MATSELDPEHLIDLLDLTPHPEGGHFAEIWHHYAGAPLALTTWVDGAAVVNRRLGTDVMAGERPQLLVEPGEWQSARTLGDWTLVGNTVSPGFEFGQFELAEPGWQPSAAESTS